MERANKDHLTCFDCHQRKDTRHTRNRHPQLTLCTNLASSIIAHSRYLHVIAIDASNKIIKSDQRQVRRHCQPTKLVKSFPRYELPYLKQSPTAPGHRSDKTYIRIFARLIPTRRRCRLRYLCPPQRVVAL